MQLSHSALSRNTALQRVSCHRVTRITGTMPLLGNLRPENQRKYNHSRLTAAVFAHLFAAKTQSWVFFQACIKELLNH